MGGGPELGANPESLFAAGYAACFGSAFSVVAATNKLMLPSEPQITAIVKLQKRGPSDFYLDAELIGSVRGMSKVAQIHTSSASFTHCLKKKKNFFLCFLFGLSAGPSVDLDARSSSSLSLQPSRQRQCSSHIKGIIGWRHNRWFVRHHEVILSSHRVTNCNFCFVLFCTSQCAS